LHGALGLDWDDFKDGAVKLHPCFGPVTPLVSQVEVTPEQRLRPMLYVGYRPRGRPTGVASGPHGARFTATGWTCAFRRTGASICGAAPAANAICGPGWISL